MTDAEKLSMLLDGDLSHTETAELRARIEAEPELAALWQAMQGLPLGLAALDDELPPAHLDEAILSPRERRAGEGSRWPWMVGLAVAAAALLALWPSAVVEVVQASGTQRYDGPVHVLVGDVEVDIDGVADVTVEPPAALLRETPAGGLPMDRTHLLTALAGATITVAVYEGSAAIHGGSDAHAHIGPGETHRIEGSAPRSNGGNDASEADAVAQTEADDRPSPEEMDIASLRGEVADLRDKLELAEAAAEWQAGQLALVEGDPVEWTDDIPEALRPEVFEDTVLDVVSDYPGAELVSMDCSEFPCVASIQLHDNGPDWDRNLKALGAELEAGTGSENVMHMLGRTDQGAGDPVNMLTIAHLDDELDSNVAKRAKHRADELMQQSLAERVHAQEEAAGDGGE